MNSDLKKGIKGQMILPYTDECIKYINENIEVFKAVCDRDFRFCIFEMYEATYEGENVIGFDFNLLNTLSKNVEDDFKRLKKEMKNHFGFPPTVILKAKYDRI